MPDTETKHEIDTTKIDQIVNEIDAELFKATSTPVDVRPNKSKADQLRHLMRAADLSKMLEAEIKMAFWLAKGETDPREGDL